MHHAREYGIDAFLLKPIMSQMLRESLQEVFANEVGDLEERAVAHPTTAYAGEQNAFRQADTTVFLRKLIALCADSDMEAVEHIDELKRHLLAVGQHHASARIENALKRYDFDLVVDLLTATARECRLSL